MLKTLKPALPVFLLLTLLTGIVYPILVTTTAQVVFPHQANGSLLVKDGKAIGSELIGQLFEDPRYFWGRPSATTPPYNAAASSGSNLGPTNPAQQQAVQQRLVAIQKSAPADAGRVPVDLVTASASGLDPHISPAAAEYQVARVAKSRAFPVEKVRQLVAEHTEQRTLGLLGEPRVNVLLLNLALDGVAP